MHSAQPIGVLFVFVVSARTNCLKWMSSQAALCAAGLAKALVVVEMAIVLSVIFGCAYTVCTCIEIKYTMLAALYVAFKEEIYFDMFFKKYIFNLPFFRNCRMQLFFFFMKKKVSGLFGLLTNSLTFR